ncbi:MAG: nitrite reductase (NAD(P)H) small subunit [Thermoleophilaceae bacterium]|nr:nitrite reductase (NAD(P)H) small subunit [Thermoleophilaceae bacterium]
MTALCKESDVPLGEGRSIAFGDGRIGVFNTVEGFFAIDNACPHLGGPLSDGILSDSCVTCPLHGRRIELATGEVLGHDEQVTTYPLEVRDGTIWMMPND